MKTINAGEEVVACNVSMALAEMRDLRDYLVQSEDGVPLDPGGSGCTGKRAQCVTGPFTIKEDWPTLSLFTREDIRELVELHVRETGQVFEQEAIEAVWDAT